MIIPNEHHQLYDLLKLLDKLHVARIKSAFGANKRYGIDTNKAYLMGSLIPTQKPYSNCLVVIFE